MSNLERQPAIALAGGAALTEEPAWELLDGRDVVLGGTRAMGTGGMVVSRTLPNRTRRMVGAWCFVDHFDATVGSRAGMDIPPHPHTGLQTVTWLLQGTVRHHDSLGNTQLIRPGQLNLMTAGRAIAHAEVSPTDAPAALHGVQLWTALPDGARGVAPHFEHHAELPLALDGPVQVRVLAGELAGVTSPARTYTPLVGAELITAPDAEVTLPLRPDFEYAVLPLTGPAEVDGVRLDRARMLYLGLGRDEVSIGADAARTVLLLGGEPFTERIVMWWNFIGRSHDEIVADREDWTAGRRFGPVVGYEGDPLPAPPLPTTALLPRGRVR